jgi:SAM-dependent methyltransferase
MRITCTRERVYADLAEPPSLTALTAAEPLATPGMRALVLGGGTGWAGARLARVVGPSGAVVSLSTDPESVRFAQRRYRVGNAAFEAGGIESLRGETDGAFGLVILMDDAGRRSLEAGLGELWRLVAAGGALVIIQPEHPEHPAADALDVLHQTAGAGARVERLVTTNQGFGVFAAFRPAE